MNKTNFVNKLHQEMQTLSITSRVLGQNIASILLRKALTFAVKLKMQLNRGC